MNHYSKIWINCMSDSNIANKKRRPYAQREEKITAALDLLEEMWWQHQGKRMQRWQVASNIQKNQTQVLQKYHQRQFFYHVTLRRKICSRNWHTSCFPTCLHWTRCPNDSAGNNSQINFQTRDKNRTNTDADHMLKMVLYGTLLADLLFWRWLTQHTTWVGVENVQIQPCK